MVIEKMNPDDIVRKRPALPLDGNEGGLSEILIDKPEVSVDIIDKINKGVARWHCRPD